VDDDRDDMYCDLWAYADLTEGGIDNGQRVAIYVLKEVRTAHIPAIELK
jgi:hypothetical protein